MLAAHVYERIYKVGLRGGTIVEVGTAMGAATVALALGLKASGKPGHVFSFDPMTGGPRRSINTTPERLGRIEENLSRYGVRDFVTVTPRDLYDGFSALPKDEKISVLMLDADGRIDRDLATLRGRLAADCFLIIDDVADLVRVKRHNKTYRVDSKMRLSWLLTNMLIEKGRLSPGERLINTYFGASIGEGPIISPGEALEVYRELVFQSAPANLLQRMKNSAIHWLEALGPDITAKLRKGYRGVKYRDGRTENLERKTI
ncbi:methyltransferase family protein [Novosphingobium sp. PhB55]|nr:methyltransferase family protein [Novosphingobium sp. PhB55]